MKAIQILLRAARYCPFWAIFIVPPLGLEPVLVPVTRQNSGMAA